MTPGFEMLAPRGGDQRFHSTSLSSGGNGSPAVVCQSASNRLWRGRMADNDYVTGGGPRI